MKLWMTQMDQGGGEAKGVGRETKEAKPKKGGETDGNPPRLGRTASYLNSTRVDKSSKDAGRG